MASEVERHINEQARFSIFFARRPGEKVPVLNQVTPWNEWPDSEDRARIETETQGGE